MPSAARGAVLVIEDDAETRAAYRGLLEHAGWRVLEASDGEQGVLIARDALPRAVIIDIAIPGVDGWEAARRLRADARTRDLPVLVVTGHALDEDRQRARELGCAGYLVKPVSPPELIAQVERISMPSEEAR